MSVFNDLMAIADARPAFFIVTLETGHDFVFRHDSDLDELWKIAAHASDAVKAVKRNQGICTNTRIANMVTHVRRRHVGFREWVPLDPQPHVDNDREKIVAGIASGIIRAVDGVFMEPGETIDEPWDDNQFLALAEKLPHAFNELFKQVDAAVSIGTSREDYEYIQAKKKS